MYDALIRNTDGSIDYIKIVNGKLVGVNFSGSGVKNSNKDNIIKFFKSFLYNKNCVFLGYYKDYEIHYDKETNLKHFLKDGKENYELLFQFNGWDAILCDGPRLGGYRNNGGILKEFLVFGVIGLVWLSGFLKLLNMVEPYIHYDVNKTTYAVHRISDSYFEDYEKFGYKQAIEKIRNSNLDSASKEYLANEELLQDVFKYYKGTPLEYTANLKFEDLQIISYEDAVKVYNHTPPDESSGFYNSLYPDKLFVKDISFDNWYFKVIAHEFVHLLQAEGLPYSYLVESSAELMASEYFDFTASSYKPSVENLKLLIEIVGPEPVLKMIFGGDDSQLLEIFKNNLSSSEYNQLKNALCNSVRTFKDDDAEIHNIIRDLLCRLYKGINGKDVREDTNIMYDLVYDRKKYASSSDFPSSVYTHNYCYLNARKMNQSAFIYFSGIDCDKLVDDGYLKEDDVYECHKYNITLDEYYDILANGNYPDFRFDTVVDEDYKVVGNWDYKKHMFELFDKKVPITEYNTGEYRQNISSKFISLDEAVKANYVNISVMDFIPKDKYKTPDYKDWEFGGKVYYSVSENIIYDVSSHSVIYYKSGLSDIFKDQYDRMINHTNQGKIAL